MSLPRFTRVAALGALALALGACSTGVEEADRAIFAEACSGVTGATSSACACAFDELQQSGGSDQVISDTLDDLRLGRAPQRLTRAIATCTTQN
jgi:hypothetical protein